MSEQTKVVVLNEAPHNRIEKGLACLANAGVTSDHWQQATIDDPIARRCVASALKGEVATPITQDDWLEREAEILSQICDSGKGSGMFSVESLRPALNRAVEEWGEPTEHWRVIPGAYTLPDLFEILYRLEDKWQEDHSGKSFLCGRRKEEWWRTSDTYQPIATELGVMVCNLETCANPTDLDGAPYYLNREEQEAWVKTQGAEEMMSAEEVIYLFIRSIMGLSRPLWPAGTMRCRNNTGSGGSLSVYWHARDGLSVSGWHDVGPSWCIGALPRKLVLA